MKSVRFLCLLLIVCTATACREKKEAENKPSAAQPIRVKVEAVVKGPIRELLEASGETQALTVLRLASPVAGRITALASQVGDRLARDAVAARVIPIESDAALRGFEVLRRAGGGESPETPSARRLAHDLASRDVAVRVPFAAVVSERLRNPGEQVPQGEVLLEVFDPRSLYVLAQVPADRAAGLAGKPAEISGSGMRSSAKVAAVLPSVAPQSLTVPIRLSLEPGADVPLLHASVSCRITVASREDALLVPRTALVTPLVSQNAEVMVAKGGHAERRKITIGLRTDTTVEAVEGISEGDLLIAEGGYGLPDGTAVEPEREGESKSKDEGESKGEGKSKGERKSEGGE